MDLLCLRVNLVPGCSGWLKPEPCCEPLQSQTWRGQRGKRKYQGTKLARGKDLEYIVSFDRTFLTLTEVKRQ